MPASLEFSAPAGTPALGLAVALGIGLLIGLERERRKGEGPERSPAGIRTFALAALVGGIGALLPDPGVFVVAAAFVAALVAIAYARSRSRDPGLTTEVALMATFLLGGLATRDPALASGVGVVVAVLLAARGWLHRFVHRVLTEQELHDGLVFAAAALVVLPLAPDRGLGPFGALNPRTIWLLVVLVMAAGGAGYVAMRLLGPRAGLPIAGFTSGFVSSTVTIGSMGARARQDPGIAPAAAAGAILSTIATMVQLVLVLGATSVETLRAVAAPLAAGGLAALLYGLVFAASSRRRRTREEGRPGPAPGSAGTGGTPRPGTAFDLRVAIGFAATVSVILFVSAAVTAWIGAPGLLAAVALAGLADAHSAAISVASLVASDRLPAADAALPILVGITTNTISKCVMAASGGGRRFALATIPGLLLVAAATWAAWALT